MVGFNRRFAPLVLELSGLLEPVRGPKSFVMTINAGAIPPDHWTQDEAVGGGRLVGEACHFIDLLRHLAGCKVVRLSVQSMRGIKPDSAMIQLHFEDGSIGSIHYLANGNKAFPKERLEVFATGGVLQLDNFRRLRGFGWRGFSASSLWRQDKGQRACIGAFVDAAQRGDPSPISFSELLEVSELSIRAQELVSS
jgi:predicted dehydrogenase